MNTRVPCSPEQGNSPNNWSLCRCWISGEAGGCAGAGVGPGVESEGGIGAETEAGAGVESKSGTGVETETEAGAGVESESGTGVESETGADVGGAQAIATATNKSKGRRENEDRSKLCFSSLNFND